MKIEIELEPMAVELLSDIGKFENRDYESVLQSEINGFIFDRIKEEAGHSEPDEARDLHDKAQKFFDSW